MFVGLSDGTVASQRPGGGSPPSRVDLRELRWLVFGNSASSVCSRFFSEPVLKFDFRPARFGEFCRQYLHKSSQWLCECRPGHAQRASRRRQLKPCKSLHGCSGREHCGRFRRRSKCAHRIVHGIRTGDERRFISFRQLGSDDSKRRQRRTSSHCLCEDGFNLCCGRSFWRAAPSPRRF